MVSLSIAFVPEDDKYILEGDLVLGGLFPIHSTFKPELEKCSDIQGQDGIQALEAMKYSIQTINKELKILPGLSLGMVGVDTCESETISLDNTNELLDMRINKNVNTETCTCKSGDTMTNNLIGVIGPASSKLSIPVASLLRLFKVPQISYQSTSPELSDKTRFQYFKRTVPSDYFQAKAIADLLKNLEYQYISIVYEDSSYGFNFKSMLEKLTIHGNFCVGVSMKLPYDPSDTQNQHTIKTLLKHKNMKDTTVVVLILRPHTAIELFKAVSQTTHAKSSFHWIATDGWAGRTFKNYGINDVLGGSVGVQLFLGDIPGFKKYFTSLVKGNPTNPWWQDYTDTDADGCTPDKCDVEEFGILHYINDAVKTFAYAIRGMHEAYCGKIDGLCDSLKTALRGGTQLLEFLGNVSFKDDQNETFQFVNSSEGPARYSILRYSSDEKEQWETIGNFSQVGDTERIFVNNKYRDEIYRGPIVCSHPCQYGYAKTVSEDRCCWKCTKCSGNQYSGEFGCMSCPVGSHPNYNKSNCTPIHIDFMSFNDPAAIGTLTLSSIGIAMCIVVIVVFTINRETPLVKATDLKLSLLLVFSLILSYGSSAAFLAKPTPISCGLIRYLLGLCYTLQYATLLTKTIRIYRLFQAKSPEKKKFINSRSSITLTLLITFFHVLGLTAWIIFDRPDIRVDYDERQRRFNMR
ncbi:unnamed protein product [Mytilus coruscus]|uniref:G-protein coupled receptors family 3 profile domain-containing protein n=1 Tax=Mytilus coruscus TaxID=42192 RepID=A0A6J8DP17_MYTCO|nr:unnamed protein product [Mytilus coruscus]